MYMSSALIQPIIRGILREALYSKESCRNGLISMGLTEEVVTNRILERMTLGKIALTQQDCVSILTGTYNDGFDPSTCIVYHQGKAKPQWARNHKHCGLPKGEDEVCSRCCTTTEGQRVRDKIRSGDLDQDNYRALKSSKRKAAAKAGLESMDVSHCYLGNTLLLHTEGDTYHSPEHNVYVRKVLVDTVYKYITTGKRLSLNKLISLKGSGITVDVACLTPECLEFVNTKINKRRG